MTEKKKITDIRSEKPVFIVGMNGSGTTMLLDHLNNHPELFGFRLETRVLPHFIGKLPGYGDLCIDNNFLKMWNEMRVAHPFVVANARKPVPLPDDWREMKRGVADVFDRIMMHFAMGAGKARWCEKTPMHVLHITKLSELFPDARFIHTIRDGRECAASFFRRWGYNPQRTMFRWKNVVREGRRQGNLLGDRYLEVRYNDLTSDPESGMKRICEFVSVDYDPDVLKSSRYRPQMSGSEGADISRNPAKYRQYFNDTTVDRLESIGGSTLAELGYDTRYPDANEDPSAWRIKQWTITDYCRQGLYESKEIFRNRRKNPVRMILGRVRTALMQYRSNNTD